MKKEIFHIAICTDVNYEPYAIALAQQLNKRSSNQLRYELHLHTLTIKGFRAEELNKYCESIGLKHSVYEYDLESLSREFLGAGHISNAAYLKIFIGSLLPREIIYCTFMDLDIYVVEDPVQLFRVQNSFAVSAVTHTDKWTHHPAFLNVDRNFHSGLMALNLEAWREKDLTLKFLESHREYGSLPYADNDLMVLSLTDFGISWGEIPSKFNLVDCHECRIQLGKQGPIIVHFAGAAKPWNAPFGGIYARRYRKDFKVTFPDFRITSKQYRHFFRVSATNFLYKITVKHLLSLRDKVINLMKKHKPVS